MKKFNRETFNKIYLILKNRLQEPGHIATYDAWLVANNSGFSYSTVCSVFRDIIRKMEDQGVARQLRQGLWWIAKDIRINDEWFAEEKKKQVPIYTHPETPVEQVFQRLAELKTKNEFIILDLCDQYNISLSTLVEYLRTRPRVIQKPIEEQVIVESIFQKDKPWECK